MASEAGSKAGKLRAGAVADESSDSESVGLAPPLSPKSHQLLLHEAGTLAPASHLRGSEELFVFVKTNIRWQSFPKSCPIRVRFRLDVTSRKHETWREVGNLGGQGDIIAPKRRFEYKTNKMNEHILWESCQNKYVDIRDLFWSSMP